MPIDDDLLRDIEGVLLCIGFLARGYIYDVGFGNNRGGATTSRDEETAVGGG